MARKTVPDPSARGVDWYEPVQCIDLLHAPDWRRRCRGHISPSSGKGHTHTGKRKFLLFQLRIKELCHNIPRISILDGSEDQARPREGNNAQGRILTADCKRSV